MPRRPRRGTFRAAACHCCRGLGLTTHSFSLCASVNSGMKKFQAGWNDFSSNPKYWLTTLSVGTYGKMHTSPVVIVNRFF